jgi:hypothetical protein
MFTAKQYRAKSDEYGELGKKAVDPAQIRKYLDSSGSFSSLADNEDWLAGNFDKTLQASDEKQLGYVYLAAKEEHDDVAKVPPDGGSWQAFAD